MNIGSIRRIDELGRIVIPKNIRKELKITQGENLKIYIKEEKIIMEKYSELSKEIEIEKVIAKTLKEILKADIIITDKEKKIIKEGCKYKEATIEEEIIDAISTRKKKKIETKKQNTLINPIIVNGDIIGTIIVITDKIIDKTITDTIDIMTRFLIKYIE